MEGKMEGKKNMTVHCSYCADKEFCIRHDGEWICKTCFIAEGKGSINEFWAITHTEKQERGRQRVQEWEDSNSL